LPEERQVLTNHVEIQFAGLRAALEEQYQRRTEQLTELTVRAAGGQDSDPVTTDALIVSCRQALVEIAHALRMMAEGRYGICARCRREIAVERLEVLPHTRFCTPCQRRQAR
jgi:DnaK suppressor protein